MKVALVHDYIKEYGGAERVLESLHEIWPDAPVYTLVYLPEFLGPHKERFKNWNIRTSIAQHLPFKAKLISPLRLVAPFLFSSIGRPASGWDFSSFDVVVVSATGAYTPNSIQIKNQKSKSENSNYTLYAKRYPLHICYCHAPPRYLYGYMTAREWKKNRIVRFVGEVMNHFLRLIDFKSAQNVDYFIANSEEVRSRIKKFYRKDAVVIYPPVQAGPVSLLPRPMSSVDKLPAGTRRGSPALATRPSSARTTSHSYYLAGGRLARAKGVDVIVEAFEKLGKPLKIFGKGFAGYEKELKSQNSQPKAGPPLAEKVKTITANAGSRLDGTTQNSKVEFLGEVSDEEKLDLMRNARAYVFASYDEDFGITPVEAMSVGTPVIAYNSGGVKETVMNGKTGVLYEKNTPEELMKAVQRFEQGLTISSQACIKQGERFSKARFKKRIEEFVKEKIK